MKYAKILAGFAFFGPIVIKAMLTVYYADEEIQWLFSILMVAVFLIIIKLRFFRGESESEKIIRDLTSKN